jgi:hypothetical protein
MGYSVSYIINKIFGAELVQVLNWLCKLGVGSGFQEEDILVELESSRNVCGYVTTLLKSKILSLVDVSI